MEPFLYNHVNHFILFFFLFVTLSLYIYKIYFLLSFVCLNYRLMFFISVGSYQVGYTRSHPNTEVKMLRACSVPLCSHRWERQVIYLFVFFIPIHSDYRYIPYHPYIDTINTRDPRHTQYVDDTRCPLVAFFYHFFFLYVCPLSFIPRGFMV